MKVKELKSKYFSDYVYKSSYESPFKKMGKIDQQKEIDKFRFMTNHTHLMDFYVNGEKVELLKWGKMYIKISRDGVDEVIKHNDLKRISYRGVYNGKTIIDKPAKSYTFEILNN